MSCVCINLCISLFYCRRKQLPCARSHSTNEDEDTYHVTEEDNMFKLVCFVSLEVVPNLCEMFHVLYVFCI